MKWSIKILASASVQKGPLSKLQMLDRRRGWDTDDLCWHYEVSLCSSITNISFTVANHVKYVQKVPSWWSFGLDRSTRAWDIEQPPFCNVMSLSQRPFNFLRSSDHFYIGLKIFYVNEAKNACLEDWFLIDGLFVQKTSNALTPFISLI